MRSQTIKHAKLRLARFEAVRVYSYSLFGGLIPIKRAGVYGKKV